MSDRREFTLASTSFPPSSNPPDEEDRLFLDIVERGRQADLSVRWLRMMDASVYPQLTAFDDAWWALPILAPVLAPFTDKNVPPADLIAAFERAGFSPSELHGQLYRPGRRRRRHEPDLWPDRQS